MCMKWIYFFQAEDGIRVGHVTGVQTCALPISPGIAREICGMNTTTNRPMKIESRKGSSRLITGSISRSAMRAPTNRTLPTGGVTTPAEKAYTTMVPKWMGWTPISDTIGAKIGTKIRMAGVASTGPCCTRLPTGSTPLMPLYHRYHLHRFVDGHVLVSPPQGLSVPEPRPSITVGGLAVYGRGHGNSARAAAGRSRGTAPGRTPPSRAAAPERTAPQLPGGGTACTYARGAGRDRGAGADRDRKSVV